MKKPNAYDPMLTRDEIISILEAVYNCPKEHEIRSMGMSELRDLFDSYIRGVQQKLDQLSREEEY